MEISTKVLWAVFIQMFSVHVHTKPLERSQRDRHIEQGLAESTQRSAGEGGAVCGDDHTEVQWVLDSPVDEGDAS